MILNLIPVIELIINIVPYIEGVHTHYHQTITVSNVNTEL